MSKSQPQLLIAKTLVSCDGKLFGVNQQFHADPTVAAALIESGQAEAVVSESDKPEASPPAAISAAKK